MHEASLDLMECYAEQYAAHSQTVLDVGAYNVNGCYREIFESRGLVYTGLDIQRGPNVDIVTENPYQWEELNGAKFHHIISGQCLEHVRFPWLTFKQIAEHLKPGGMACVIVPSCGPIHRYPIDTFRYNPDGIESLGQWAGLKMIDCKHFPGNYWGDLYAVFTAVSDIGFDFRR